MASRARPRLVLSAALLLAACGKDAPEPKAEPEQPALASRDCAPVGSDTAQAVCIALNAVERIAKFRSTPRSISRRGDTLCIHTAPASGPAVLDGEGRVDVVHGEVVHAEVGDSLGCPSGQ